jgi:hypothetical protein
MGEYMLLGFKGMRLGCGAGLCVFYNQRGFPLLWSFGVSRGNGPGRTSIRYHSFCAYMERYVHFVPGESQDWSLA